MSGRIKNRPEQMKQVILPRIGKIKTGIKNEGSNYPRSLDYFVATGPYKDYFHRIYGEKPNRIQVVFLSDEPKDVCNERYELRDSEGKLFSYGDGEVFKVWDGKKYVDRLVSENPNLMEDIKRYCTGKYDWEVILTLRFILPLVNGVMGHWEFSTKGKNSTIPNIISAFDAVLESNTFVKGIIFDLSVEFAKSQKPGKKSKYPVVNLIPNETEENVQLVKNSKLLNR